MKHSEKRKQIGLRIAFYRKLKGLTQEQLAERLDVGLAHIGGIEAANVERAMSLDILLDIAEVLEIPAYKFLFFDEDNI